MFFFKNDVFSIQPCTVWVEDDIYDIFLCLLLSTSNSLRNASTVLLGKCCFDEFLWILSDLLRHAVCLNSTFLLFVLIQEVCLVLIPYLVSSGLFFLRIRNAGSPVPLLGILNISIYALICQGFIKILPTVECHAPLEHESRFTLCRLKSL